MKISFILLTLLLPIINCFPNGTMLPCYFCYSPNQGYPTSLGDVLISLPNITANIALNLAIAHNQHSIFAQKKLITVVKNDQPYFSITLGSIVSLFLESTANFTLDGALLYAIDDNNNKIGNFLEFGLKMQEFPSCGLNATGIVHNQVLSENTIYSGIIWKAPDYLVNSSFIHFTGLAVTDQGFGKFVTSFNFVYKIIRLLSHQHSNFGNLKYSGINQQLSHRKLLF